MLELQNLLETAWRVGCPADQMAHFGRGLYVPLPWTLPFHAAAREADAESGPDDILIGGSRGPGKSHAIFSQVALDDCQRYPGLKFLYLRKVGKRAREQMNDLRRATIMALPHRYNRVDGVIEFDNGSRIITGHFNNESDVDNYLGLQYDGAAIEEDTTLSNTKVQAINDSIRSTIPGWRPRKYRSTNPGSVGHLRVKQRFVVPWRNGTETFTRFFPATVDDNYFINADYTRNLEMNTGWRLRAYRYGDWDIAAGQYFDTFRHETHVIAPFQIPSDWLVWASLDYGYVHPTVVYLHAMDGDGQIYTVAEHRAQRWQISQHAEALKTMFRRWGVEPARLETFVAGTDVFTKKDPGAPTIAEQYAEEGFDLRAAKVDRVNGWAHVLRLLGDPEKEIPARWHIFNTCPHLLEKLPLMEHDPHRPEDILKVDVDDEGQGGDDEADAVRYGLMESETFGRTGWSSNNPLTAYRG